MHIDGPTATVLAVAITSVTALIFRVLPPRNGLNCTLSRKMEPRLAVVESKQKAFGDWLEKVEAKLDKVIENRNPK